MRLQTFELFCCELEVEVFGESDGITFDGLIDTFCLDLIEWREVAIEHDLYTTDGIDAVLDVVFGRCELWNDRIVLCGCEFFFSHNGKNV